MALQVQKLLKSAKLINSTRAFTTGTFDKGLNENASKKMHIAVQRDYPTAKQLPLPPNIDIAETARFSPLRNRDITASALIVHQELIDVTLDQKPDTQRAEPIMDPHLEIYDRRGSVNLSSVMQSTVPEPYGGNHSFSHLNMPGSQWCIQVKYLSHELNSAHYTQLRQEVRSDWSHYSTQPYKVD